MNFDKAADFWIDNVLFGPLEAAFYVTRAVEKSSGGFASLMALMAMLGPVVVGLVCSLVLTAAVLVALVITAPLTIPLSIYLHRKPDNR